MKPTTPTIDEKKQQLIIPGTTPRRVELAWGMADPQMIRSEMVGRYRIIQEPGAPAYLEVTTMQKVIPHIGLDNNDEHGDWKISVWERLWNALKLLSAGRWSRAITVTYLLRVVRERDGSILWWVPITDLPQWRSYEVPGTTWGQERLP